MTSTSTPSAPPDLTAVVDEATQVSRSRRRIRGSNAEGERSIRLVLGAAFLGVAIAWPALARPHLRADVVLCCLAAYVAAGVVEFEIGPGMALPTTPVLIVSLLLLPAPVVPALVMAGLFGASLVARFLHPERRDRLLIVANSGWHCVGPAAVFAALGLGRAELRHWPAYAAALAAQLAADALASWLSNCVGLGIPARALFSALRATFAVDVLLAPLGLAAALAAPDSPGALLFVLPVVLLLAGMQRERRRHIDGSLTLTDAFSEAAAAARRDALTGLANRLCWEEDLLARSAGSAGVVLADVDGLKAANDTFGHETGDRLIVAVAAAFSAAVPEAVVYRLGGDEMAVLLPAGASPERLAATVQAAVHALPPVDGVVAARVSVGWAEGPAREAVRDADRAMYDDKARRRAVIC